MMLWRLGLLVGLCLVLTRCEDVEEVIPCEGGECVKLHLCPYDRLNRDGSSLIDIRSNPENDCADYLLKCCPIPKEDEDDVVPPPPSVSGTSPVPVGPSPGPGIVPDHSAGPVSVPSNQGSNSVFDTANNGLGSLGIGNKPAGVHCNSSVGGVSGYGKPVQGYDHGSNQGQHELLDAKQIYNGGITTANQVKDEKQVSQVHGGGPASPSGQPGEAGVKPVSPNAPPGGNVLKPTQPSTGDAVDSGVIGGNVPTKKPGQESIAGNEGPGTDQQSVLGGPGNVSGSVPTQKPNTRPGGHATDTHQSVPGGSASSQGGSPTTKPAQPGVVGVVETAPDAEQPSPGGPAPPQGGIPTKKPKQSNVVGAGGPKMVAQQQGHEGLTPPQGSVTAEKPGQLGVEGNGGLAPDAQQQGPGGPAPPQGGITATKPGPVYVQPTPGGPGVPPEGIFTEKPPVTSAKPTVTSQGYKPGGVKNQRDKFGATTQNPFDETINVAETCGRRNAMGVGFRITGDNDGESEYGEFPWMVAILKEERALEQVINVYQCGGSLIHPSVVLTAAHCVQNRETEEVKVRLGEWDTQTKNEMYDYQDRNVVEIVSHAEFNKGPLFNDVALLFLEKPANLMETVNTICLPPANYNFDMSRCFASGWGKDVFGKQGTYQVILKKIELPIMPRKQCQKALRTTRLGWRFNLHSSFICAGGEKGRDTCKGDGGSPLICPISGSNNHYYQAGIVAWGIGCGEDGIPGVYVNVPMFRGWIEDHLRQRNITDSKYYNYNSNENNG